MKHTKLEKIKMVKEYAKSLGLHHKCFIKETCYEVGRLLYDEETGEIGAEWERFTTLAEARAWQKEEK